MENFRLIRRPNMYQIVLGDRVVSTEHKAGDIMRIFVETSLNDGVDDETLLDCLIDMIAYCDDLEGRVAIMKEIKEHIRECQMYRE